MWIAELDEPIVLVDDDRLRPIGREVEVVGARSGDRADLLARRGVDLAQPVAAGVVHEQVAQIPRRRDVVGRSPDIQDVHDLERERIDDVDRSVVRVGT